VEFQETNLEFLDQVSFGKIVEFLVDFHFFSHKIYFFVKKYRFCLQFTLKCMVILVLVFSGGKS